MATDERQDSQRLDSWLWCARIRRTRADCARLAGEGLIRINRIPTAKAHARVRIGDVLTVPLPGEVIVVRVLALAERRGPATAAVRLYAKIDEPAAPVSCAVPLSPSYRGP